MTPGDVRACIAVLLRSGRVLRGAKARSISSSSRKFSALRSALCELRPPFRPCGLDIRHTLRQPGTRPFSFPPRRATVSSRAARLVCPLSQPYHLRLENTRDKNLKNHDYLDHQAHSLRGAVLGFEITFVVMMTGLDRRVFLLDWYIMMSGQSLSRIKNLLLTGSPGCGKTTVLERVAAHLGDLRLAGFLTLELREHGQRVGFEAVGLGGHRAILAHVRF